MTIINALPFNLQNGTTADATQVMADFNEIVNDVNNNAAHNGVNTDITALTALTTPITPAQGGGTIFYGAGSGTANVQLVASTAPTGFTLTAGYSVYWIPSVTNTGALTLNVNGTGAKNVFARGGGLAVACIGGEVDSGVLTKATYDGTQWVLDLDVLAVFGPLAGLASAAPDLGTALSHTVNITGTTTITSFGSTATITRPLYRLVFSGALILTYNATSLILPGSANITTANGDAADALYLGSGNWQITSYYRRNGQAITLPASSLQNYITGLILSTAGGSGTFGITAGEATDSTNTSVMLLNSAYTKTTASWAVGTGNGGLDTGAIANGTWYHVFEIQRPDTGVVDICFSLSPTAPTTGGTIPAAYTLFRRIGSMSTDGAAHWRAFTQVGDQFIWNAMVTELSSLNSVTRVVLTMTGVPTGIVVAALLRGVAVTSATAGGMLGLFTSLLESDQAPSITAADVDLVPSTAQGFNIERLTNTSAQIGYRTNNTNGTLSLSSYGWKDTRGKN